MEAYANDPMRERIRDRLREIRDTKGRNGKGLAGVESATGISRSALSKFVNDGYLPDTRRLETLGAYLTDEYGEMNEEVRPSARRFGADGEIFPTKGYGTAFAAIDDFRTFSRTCVLIGDPGLGKTTLLREYAHQRPDTYYIDCWPFMGMSDVCEAIARAMDVPLRNGSVMKKVTQLMKALDERPGALLIYDEAENLAESSVRKLDTLRKLTDPEDAADMRRVPMRTTLFAGTKVLEDTLKRRAGQVLRRASQVVLRGPDADDVGSMLSGYPVTEGAKRMLTEMALDTAHGGLGNFVEVLNICLNHTEGREIGENTVRAARKYKMLY